MTNELVRVRLDNGVETNLSRVHAESVGAEVLDESPFDGAQPRPDTRNGEPFPKPQTSVAKQAAEKKGAVTKSAPTTKE